MDTNETELFVIGQAISALLVRPGTVYQPEERYEVGEGDVTRIEGLYKSGPYSYIPYIRVWCGEVCRAEFCQHGVVGVYYETREEAAA